ncbi:MAG: hypothetical protein IKS63_04585 [Firmicutes bacterium]|nr:hypothetical protein [Bacillota bacterium]
MRNADERITKMHARAAELRRHADRTRSKIFGSISAALAVCLVFVVHQIQSAGHGIMAGQNTGSSMLSDSAGGYVLIAVIAFVAGTVITALIIKHRKR